MKTLTKKRFDNIKVTIINNSKSIDLDLINKNRKKIYRKIFKKNNNTKKKF